eukprot:201608-Karenia_brevis.AAC.1
MVQAPKPEGTGFRTIGLTVSPMRVWSRLRSSQAAEWERTVQCDAFWGTVGRPCEKAAWTHGIYKAAGAGAKVDFASLFLDLMKFYEMVDHD